MRALSDGDHRSEFDYVSGRRRRYHEARDRCVEWTAILVGHSYGGAVITEAGNDPKVAGLVISPPLIRK